MIDDNGITEILITMIDFCEENYEAFSERFKERTGEEINDDVFDNMKNEIYN